MALKTTLDMVVSHWTQPIADLRVTPSEFYEAVVNALAARKVPDLEISRVWWKESPLAAVKREYLRIVRRRLVFDICAAPFGTGCFISSWLCIVPFSFSFCHLIGMLLTTILGFCFPPIAIAGLLLLIAFAPAWWIYSREMKTTSTGQDILLGMTLLGPPMLLWAERKPTYYQLDTAAIFQSAVQEAVMAVVDQFCEAQNLRPLSELERKPVIREFGKR